MLRRLLGIMALVVMLVAAAPRAHAATTATGTFTGSVQIQGDRWWAYSDLCIGVLLDMQGSDALCTFVASGPAAGPCTAASGSVTGEVRGVMSGITLSFTGISVVASFWGHHEIAITGFATNPSSGKVGWFTAAIDAWPTSILCSASYGEGTFNSTPVV